MWAIETTLLFTLLAYGAQAAPADGQENENKTAVPSGILQLPLIQMSIETETSGSNITKRQVSVDLNRGRFSGALSTIALGIPLEVGTPPQTVIVEPDTGSHKFWLPGLPDGQLREEPVSSFFDHKRSSSIQDLRKNGISRYKHEYAKLRLYSDEVSIAGRWLGKLKFGVADIDKSDLGRLVGVMGLRTPTDHWANDFILKRLADRQVTKSRAFSASLRRERRGSLLFGGYDAAKFSGPLEQHQMIKGNQNNYIIEMQSVSFSDGSNESPILLDSQSVNGRPLTIGLDSGSPGLSLSSDLFRELQYNLGAGVDDGFLTVNCDAVDDQATLDFKMTDKTTISILLQDFLETRLFDGQVCRLFIASGSSLSDLWAGVQFLRRSFVVYDPDQSKVHIARGADCGTNLAVIDGAVPEGVIGECEEEWPEPDPQAWQVPGTRPAPRRRTRPWPGQP